MRCSCGAGDTWHENFGLFGARAAAGASEPMVIGAYGSGARPVVATGTAVAFNGRSSTRVVDHLAIMGIRFWADTRDPPAPPSPPPRQAAATAFASPTPAMTC